MAGASGRSAGDLIEALRDDAPHFRFFQAVRLLTLASRGAAPRGGGVPAALRFRTPASLSFPASELVSARLREAGKGHDGPIEDAGESPAARPTAALELVVGFLGLTGPSGALPVPYTELLMQRQNLHRDHAMHAFLDLFSHRATSLFYQAWRKYHFYVPFEAGEHDGFSRNVLDLVGVGLANLQQRLAPSKSGVPDLFLRYFAGLLSQKPICAANIVALVKGYFGVAAALEQFVGQWIETPAQEQTRMGQNACVLGESALSGERVWDRQTRIRIVLGPLTHEQFADFLPGEPGAIALLELVRFCVGQSLACDVSLVLRKEEIPAPRLGADAALMLGFNVWAGTRPVADDARDVCFALQA